ncbi:ATP synthase subunit C lysine N-methyltransferase isoform X2 [Astyanax mexicanus]|uniref:Protein FAM173B-like isoform X3 n=1 Tax=Astyanax mexicanus TaxID=7994 RepID=A0A8T2LJ76_ASTMX|nr:ATP synthase subunit C lysine N-methyltransferase isoform X2 [Astyanax mexicanus]KAG9269982.1 protein FAM173B-like isoform X3 [Astyanax mexicanus]
MSILVFFSVYQGLVMEDSVEVILQDKRSWVSHRSQDRPVITAASGALLMGCYGLWSVFALPGFRRVPVHLKVPYLPSSGVQTQNIMRLLRGRAGRLVDLGSGDGRLVLTASSLGFQCTGYEINSILVSYARVKARLMGIPTTRARFVNEDLWKMEVLAKKLEKELGDDTRVIACRYPFPDWPVAETEGRGLDQAWAYDMTSVCKPST